MPTFSRLLLSLLGFLVLTTSLMLLWAWKTSLVANSTSTVDVKFDFVVRTKADATMYFPFKPEHAQRLKDSGTLTASHGALLGSSTVVVEPARVEWKSHEGKSEVTHTAPGVSFNVHGTLHTPEKVTSVQPVELRWSSPTLQRLSSDGIIEIHNGTSKLSSYNDAFVLMTYPVVENTGAFFDFYLGWAMLMGLPLALALWVLTIWIFFFRKPNSAPQPNPPTIPAVFAANYGRLKTVLCAFPVFFGLTGGGLIVAIMAFSSPSAYACMYPDSSFIVVLIVGLMGLPFSLLCLPLSLPQARTATLTEEGIEITYYNFGSRRIELAWKDIQEVQPMEVRKALTKQLIAEYLLIKTRAGKKVKIQAFGIQEYPVFKDLAIQMHASLGGEPAGV